MNKKLKISPFGLFCGLVGVIFIICGLIKKTDTVFILEFVFGMIALLFSLHLMSDKNITDLKKRIKQLENKK